MERSPRGVRPPRASLSSMPIEATLLASIVTQYSSVDGDGALASVWDGVAPGTRRREELALIRRWNRAVLGSAGFEVPPLLEGDQVPEVVPGGAAIGGQENVVPGPGPTPGKSAAPVGMGGAGGPAAAGGAGTQGRVHGPPSITVTHPLPGTLMAPGTRALIAWHCSHPDITCVSIQVRGWSSKAPLSGGGAWGWGMGM